MENQLESGAALHRGDNTHPAGLPDLIGNFALGVGNVQKQHVVLDIHVDNGGMVAKLLKTGAKVIGVAPLENRRALDAGITNQAPAAAIAPNIAPRSVDIVFMDLTLHHVPTPSQAILEIKRILKPGGRLVITAMGKNGDFQCGQQWTGFYPGDIRHWLKTAGFSNIIVNPVPVGRTDSDINGPSMPRQSGYLMATGTVRPKFKV